MPTYAPTFDVRPRQREITVLLEQLYERLAGRLEAAPDYDEARRHTMDVSLDELALLLVLANDGFTAGLEFLANYSPVVAPAERAD
jgi:hypothetical protein